MAEPRFKPAALYVIPGNLLNIIWEEVCMPYLAISRSPIKEQLESRIGMLRDSIREDESGRARYQR